MFGPVSVIVIANVKQAKRPDNFSATLHLSLGTHELGRAELMSLVPLERDIQSPSDISLFPDVDNVCLRCGVL